MPTINLAQPIGTPPYGGTSDGNRLVLHFVLATNAAGVVQGGDSAIAAAIADKVRLGRLPAGMRLDDAIVDQSVAQTASVAGNLGFEYVDGVDSSVVPQDASFFFSALSGAAAARTRMTQAKGCPTLPKEAYLIWTQSGAASAKVSRADIQILGEDRGPL